MVRSTNLGFPRIGQNRELKHAVEAFWAGKIDGNQLHQVARELQHRHWKLQQDAGISLIPSNDFSLYDHVLDMAALVGAVPERYFWTGGPISWSTYFAMARGEHGDDGGVPALESMPLSTSTTPMRSDPACTTSTVPASRLSTK